MQRKLLLPSLVLALCLPWGHAPAQDGIDEPDPFTVVGEKLGDEDAPIEEGPDPEEAPAAEAPTGEKAEPTGEMTPLGAQISQHILKLAEGERETRMRFMGVVIDDIVRLCELDKAQRTRLELAAKGAAERSMKEWHEQAERYFRTRLENTDADAAKDMLEGMGSVNFGGNRSEEQGETLDLWKDSLKDVLTTEQVARYEAVLKQRQLDRIDAFASMSLSAINDHLRLTPDQKTKMSEIVRTSASDYLEDVQRYWGDYFERRMLMSLANAAEEDDLKAVLTEQQFDRLREATSDFDHFWDQKRRLKRAKEKAAERRQSGEKEAGENPSDEAGVAPPPQRGAVRIEGGPGIRVKVQ